VRSVSQNSRPQPRKKSNPFFPAACTSEKTLLGLQTCERSECAAAGRIPLKKVVHHFFEVKGGSI
jgi:hypothetical protein